MLNRGLLNRSQGKIHRNHGAGLIPSCLRTRSVVLVGAALLLVIVCTMNIRSANVTTHTESSEKINVPDIPAPAKPAPKIVVPDKVVPAKSAQKPGIVVPDKSAPAKPAPKIVVPDKGVPA
eukprot:788037_1